MQPSVNFNQEEIKELIAEVSKSKPNQTKVKSLVKKFDIEFSTDPIEQMTLVLKKIDLGYLGLHSKNLQIQDSK